MVRSLSLRLEAVRSLLVYTLPLGEWTHVGIVLRGDVATLYLNGRAVTSKGGVTANPDDMGETTKNSFGKSTFAADPPFDGALDDVRLSCRAYEDRGVPQTCGGSFALDTTPA